MIERILLVDYENIQAVDLGKVPSDVKVRFVLGGKQPKLPTPLAIEAHGMGERFSYVRVQAVERDACDFCIAFYLGEYLQANPLAECVILSKDKKGFDPLVKHLTTERGFNVRRVGVQKEAFADKAVPPPKTSFERLTALLKKDKALPRKMKGLEGKVKAWFQDFSSEERSSLVQRLFREGYVSESGKALVFVAAKFRDA
jgi:PIN domain